MKRHIFILSSVLCICSPGIVGASDSMEEIEPVEAQLVEEELNVPETTEYTIDTLDEIVEAQPCQDDIIVPMESTQNLWTDDAIIANSNSMQAVILKPMQKPERPHKKYNVQSDTTTKLDNTAFSLGDQTYYGETVYIINNFLSNEADNVSETDDALGAAKFGAGIKTMKSTERWDNVSETSSAYVLKKIATQQECPFKTQSECAIWVRKPVVSEIVAPRSKKLSKTVMQNISDAVKRNPEISANASVMKPLLERYKVLMRASRSCCTGGLTYQMQKDGAPQKFIYKFLSDDANFSGFGSRCMVMNDEQIDNAENADMAPDTVSDIRNNCVCKSKEALGALLAPFDTLYRNNSAFAEAPFEYKHTDGVGRKVTDSVNIDVQNVLDQLDMCP